MQQTLTRLKGLETAVPAVICNEDHRFMVAEQLRQSSIKGASILLEPVGRNTAPAIALAALNATRSEQDPLLLVLAADHYMADEPAFHRSVVEAVKLAEQDKLVTFGIVPTHAETGYGYIQRGTAINAQGYQVARFVEKPDHARAEEYLNSGDYYWNSGMFMFKASIYLKALAEHRPDIFEACKSTRTRSTGYGFYPS